MPGIDPSIPLATQPSIPYNPVGSAMQGIQMSNALQTQQLRAIEMQNAQYQQALLKRNVMGTSEWMNAVNKFGDDDDAVTNYLTKQGYPDFAQYHLKNKAEMAKAGTEIRSARLADSRFKLGDQLQGLEDFATRANDTTNVYNRLSKQWQDAAQGNGDFPTENVPSQEELHDQLQQAWTQHLNSWADKGYNLDGIPSEYSPDAITSTRQHLQGGISAIERLMNPAQAAQIAKDEAEARLANARAAVEELKTAHARTPQEYAANIDKALSMSKLLTPKDFAASAQAAKDAIELALKHGDLEEANKRYDAFINELAQTERAINPAVAANKIGVTVQSGVGVEAGKNNLLEKAITGGKLLDASRPDPNDPQNNAANPEYGGLSANELYQAAIENILTGKTPSTPMGGARVPMYAKRQTAVANKVGAISAYSGVDIPTAQLEYQGMNASQKQLTTKLRNTEVAEEAAERNLDLALSLGGDVWRSGSKLVNRYAQWVQSNFSPAMNLSAFETALYTGAREYAKVSTGNFSNTGLTDTATKTIDSLINAAQAQGTLQSRVNTMKKDMRNVRDPMSEEVWNTPSGAVARILGVGLPPSKAKPAAQTDQTAAGAQVKGPDGQNLTGLAEGKFRTFNPPSPYAGQTWTIEKGQPKRVR